MFSSERKEPLLQKYRALSINIEEANKSEDDNAVFCNNCCMNCSECCRAIAQGCRKFTEQTANCLGEIYPLIIRPAAHGVSRFFQGPDQRYTLYRPLVDAAWYPGNPLKVIAEAVMPINPKTGSWNVPLLPVTYYRLKEFLQLLIHPIKAPKNTATALFAASLAMYTSLELICAMHCALDNEHGAQFSFNPYTVIQHLANDRPEAWQKAVLALTGYIGALNGYLLGRDLPSDLTRWWKTLWAEVRTDNFDHHLKQLEILDPDAAESAKENYYEAVYVGKDWKVLDLTERALQRALWLPSVIFQLPRKLAAEINIPITAKCLSGENAPLQSNTKVEITPYYELLAAQRNQYSRFAPQNIRSIRLFGSTDQTTWRERRQLEEMTQHFLAEVTRINLVGDDAYQPGPPFGVSVPPTNKKWQESARNDEVLKRILRGEVRNKQEPRTGLAQMFYYHLYDQHYCSPSMPPFRRQRSTTIITYRTPPTGHVPTPSPSDGTPTADILNLDSGPAYRT